MNEGNVLEIFPFFGLLSFIQGVLVIQMQTSFCGVENDHQKYSRKKHLCGSETLNLCECLVSHNVIV
jgi:hypothetical protein